jgi:hypothetical protein
MTILDHLNRCVKTTDHLYFLGDFSIGGPMAAASYRERIRCKKIYFILGNHDKAIKEDCGSVRMGKGNRRGQRPESAHRALPLRYAGVEPISP